MEIPFPVIFFGLAVVGSLAASFVYLSLTWKLPDKDNADELDKVTAVKISERVLYGNDVNGSIATYEWEYNGVKHRIKMDNDAYGGTTLPHNMHWYGSDMPDKMEITVDRRTGKYKRHVQKRPAGWVLAAAIIFILIASYVIAAKVTGINPLID